jgi:hypothetical protein
MRQENNLGRPPDVIDAGPAILRRWRPDDLGAAADAVQASLEHLRPWMGHARWSKSRPRAAAPAWYGK